MPGPSARTLRAATSLGAAAALATALMVPTAATRAQAPGQFEVDEEAAERALERALVQTGSTLLPARSIEVSPFVSYVRRESEGGGGPVFVDGDLVTARSSVRSDELNAGLTFRAGLPWSGQIDVTVPLGHTDRDEIDEVFGATLDFDSASASGLGDVRLSYTQSLREESGGFPALLASASWDSDSGEENEGIFIGTGFNEFGVSLTATQRQDPLVFSGRVGYQRSLENDDIRPGDELSLEAGAFLAVSPETSLQFGLSVARTDDIEFDGDAIAGSDRLAASLNLGVATILRRNALLDAGLSIGLTEDAPDFGIAASVPLRFTF